MTSSIINLVIDGFLSNLIEIDKSQTYASLLSGILELRNMKIKKECFAYLNLPYFKIEKGYIGKIKIEMQMPFFYSYPINIYINDIFILIKQKDINKLKEKEEINSLKYFKNQKLFTEENIFNNLETIQNTEDNSYLNQIIKNINIDIKNIMIRFEDNISNPVNPYNLGIILKQIKIKINSKDINNIDNINNNKSDFCYKRIKINELNIFMDVMDSYNYDEIQYEKLIDIKIKELLPLEMINYLKEDTDFYVYCLTELNNNNINHDFILDKINLDINLIINYNLYNNNPKYELNCEEIEKIELKLTLNQISNFFLLLSYYNLFYFFQLGLSKKIFNKKLSDKEKEKYIIDYMKYYYNKYKEKIPNDENNYLKKIEENMDYNEIKYLRKIAMENIYVLYIEEKEIEEKLKNENNKWFFNMNKSLINELNEKLNKTKKQISEKIKNYLIDKNDLLIDKDNKDNYPNLPDDFEFYIAKIFIKKFRLIICDLFPDNNSDDNIDDNSSKRNEIIYNNLLDFNIKGLSISYIAEKYNSSYSLVIKDLILKQNIIPNKEYDKIIIAESKTNEEFILIEYQVNREENGNYLNKIIFKSGIQIILFFNLYQIQYINYNILSCLYAFISFTEISKYADDNINEYLKLGFIINENNKIIKNQKQKDNYKIKYNYDINLKEPIIIIPQDILYSFNNNCIIISAEELIIKSDLINEEINKNMNTIHTLNNDNESNSNYESCLNDSNIIDNIYDKHFLNINGIQVSLSNNCTKEDNYKNIENILIHYFNISILYKTLIDINDNNNNYNHSCFILDINELYFSFDEFQILFLINYLKEIQFQNEYLEKNKILNNNNNDIVIKKYNNEEIKKFIDKMKLKGIISEDDFFSLLNKDNINKPININTNNTIDEDYFYKNSNQFLLEVKLNQIKFIIYKIYPDLSKATFLHLELTSILFSKFTSITEDSLQILHLKNIILLNKEQDYKKNYILPQEYQYLIKNDQENINCIKYSSLYKKNKNEYLTNIELNDLNILTSFDTLTNIYTFFMYYYEKYQMIYYDGKKNNNNKDKKRINIRKSVIQIQKDLLLNKENIENIVKQYKINNQNIFFFKLRNTYLGIPSDDKNTDKPIYSMKLNIFYEQLSNSETENYYDINNRKLLKEQLLYDNRSMNIMICESDFYIIYLNQNNQGNDKIISNYRIQYNSKYTYLLSKKNSISNMNILIEPLILNMNLYQLNLVLNLYYSLMNFLYKSLLSSYIPFLKQEDVIYIKGKPIVVKRKINIKKLIKYVHNLVKYKKAFYKINDKKKKKNKNIINSFYSINLKLDKIYINILDENYFNYNKKEKRILLALEISKLLFNKINNSNPKDKTNIGNDLLSIITGEHISFDNYIKHNLYNYMVCTFTFELNHYNLEHSDFEPIIEPFDMEYFSYQTNPLFRAKTYINIKNMININVSTNSMKVLNIFLSKYSKDINDSNNNEKSKEDIVNIFSKKKTNEFLRLISKENDYDSEDQEEVVKLINKTGVLINFWFDFDEENIIKIKNDETINLTNKQIYKTRKNRKLIQKKESYKNTFSFSILNYESIQKINFNSTDNLYFKTKIIIENDEKYLYYNLKINTDSFVKEIIFESSITILNESKFDGMILSIDDNLIDNNQIILEKKIKKTIPLNWIFSTKNIFLQFNKDSEKCFAYNNVSEIISIEEISPKDINYKEKQIEDIKNSLENKLNNFEKINLNHPKYKDYISTYILQRFNKKTSKLISIKDQNNEDISFYFDYCFLKRKHLQNISEKVYQLLEYTKKSSEYIILVRPIANITNFTPYNMICFDNKDDSKIKIIQNETLEIYNNKWLDPEYLIRINLIYDNEDYETDFINIYSNNNYINILHFVSQSDNVLNCNLSHNLLSKNMNIFDNELEEYSLLSYNYILFFDFIVDNKIEFDLYGIDAKYIKDINNNIFTFISKSKSVFSSYKGDIHHLLVNSNINKFNKDMEVNVNAIDLDNVIEIENEKNIYHILCKTSNSLNYAYSNTLLFIHKYILINDLDFNIYIQQINEDMRPIDKIREVYSNKFIPLNYITQKKVIFKIGINKLSFSGIFELDNLKEYELKIEVDNSYKKKYPINTFYIGNKLYLYFRIINKITEEGNVYLLITFPHYPLLEIDNRTKEQIKIYITKDEEPIIINQLSKIPFILNNNIKSKSKFIYQILNITKVLTFYDYAKDKIKINDNKYININCTQKSLLTGTRCITFEEKEQLKNKKKKLFKKIENFLKEFSSLNRINIFIKGIGLSFLDEIPKEIFYISFYEISLFYSNFYKSSSIKEKYFFNLKNFQIDSSLNNTIKTLIYPTKQNIPSLESDNLKDIDNNFISLSIVKKKYINKRTEIINSKYLEIIFCIQEINIKIDQTIVMNLINLIKSYTSKLDYFQVSSIKQEIKEDKALNEKKMKLFIQEIKNEVISDKILINNLFLSAIKINLTFRLDISRINIKYIPIIPKIIGSLGSSLIRISDIPIELKEILRGNIYSNPREIIEIIVNHYINSSKIQVLKILGNSDLIGSPVQLIEKIGTGFIDLVNEPRKGLLKGEFVSGLYNGITGLLNGVIGGAFNSVSKISGTLYDLIQNLTGGNNDLILDEDYEPNDVITGASRGLMGGLQELYNGITGFINPIENVSNSNYKKINLFKDLGKGLLKFAVSPINFVLRIGNSISTGTFNYCYSKNIKNKRFRFPRYIKPNSLLTIYDPDLSAAKEFLFKFYKIDEPNIIYFSLFFCENKRYYGKIAYFILTDEFILLLSNKYDIILNINLFEINDFELKYNGKYFEFAFMLNEKDIKIILINRKSNAFVCELYFLLENIRFNNLSMSKSNNIKRKLLDENIGNKK